MTNLVDLVRAFEHAKSTGGEITLSTDDLVALMQVASLVGDPQRIALPEVAPVEQPVSTNSIILISIEEVAKQLRVSTRTLWRLRKTDPTFPKPLRTSARNKQFVRADFDAWLRSRSD